MLKSISKALPEAQLYVMVSDHIQSIMEVVHFIDDILGYPQFPKSPAFYENLGYIKKLCGYKCKRF